MKTKSINDLKKGETLLYRVRKVYKDLRNPDAGFKPSLEIVEFVEKQANAIADLNGDDDRFNQAKPQRAYQPASLASAIEEGWITESQFDALKPSKGVDINDQKEGVHFVTVGVLNPTFQGTRLRVRVTEVTETTREIEPKINPSNGKTVTHGGLPVYRIVDIAYEGSHESTFLASDKSTVTAKPVVKTQGKSENINA